MNRKPISLTETGEQRRTEMLESLVDEFGRYHRRKRVHSAAVVGALVAMVAALLVGGFASSAWLERKKDLVQPVGQTVEDNRAAEGNRESFAYRSIVETKVLLEKYRVRSDQRTLEKYIAREPAGRFAIVEFISDDELVDSFREIGTEGYVAVINNQKVFQTIRAADKNVPDEM